MMMIIFCVFLHFSYQELNKMALNDFCFHSVVILLRIRLQK